MRDSFAGCDAGDAGLPGQRHISGLLCGNRAHHAALSAVPGSMIPLLDIQGKCVPNG